jgi:membrane protein
VDQPIAPRGGSLYQRATWFLREGAFAGDLRQMPAGRRLALGTLRVLLHLWHNFRTSLTSLQAAGLTLLTVLAIVPLLGMATAIAKSLGYAERLDARLAVWQAQFPPDAAPGFEWLRQRIAEVNFGALGLVGTVVVLWSGLALFSQVEQALNAVWRTAHARPWYRRVTDFLALLLVVPPLAIGSVAAISMLGGLVPHVMAWIAFTALYKIMPSAPVQWRSALAGGMVAGSVVVLLHHLYVRLNVGVANANAIYLTFAAVPILLVYLQLLWTIVLAGSVVAYAVQNLGTLHSATDLPPATHHVRQRLAWHLVHAAGAAFRSGHKGVRASALCRQLDVPREWMGGVVDELVARSVLVPLQDDADLLLPARPPEQIPFAEVAEAVAGGDDPYNARVRLPDAAEAQLRAADAAAAERLAGAAF